MKKQIPFMKKQVFVCGVVNQKIMDDIFVGDQSRCIF